MLAASPARAAVAVYTNEADFVAATTGLPGYLNEFTNFEYYGELAHAVRVATNGIAYSLTTLPPLSMISFPGVISTVDTNDQVLMTFTSGNVTAVGGWFFTADTNATPADGSVTLTLTNGPSFTVSSVAGQPAPFAGFVSDGPIFTSMTVSNSVGNGPPALSHLYVVDGIPSPSLLAAGNNLVISWSSAPTGFVLQATADLKGGNWTNVSQVPQAAGDNLEVTLPASGAAAFFRLKK